jgi:hypothetical protein
MQGTEDVHVCKKDVSTVGQGGAFAGTIEEGREVKMINLDVVRH